MHPITKRILAGDVRAAARAITWIEDGFPEKGQVLQEIFPHTGKARLIGLTGSPGAGKSSLVDALITYLRSQQISVGVIAVDPTSPFTGGALLGDRIRMQHHAPDRGVFIRSMGTRGNLGGLSRNTKEAVRVLDAYGCEVIIVETVGVGQSELDIMKIVDTVAVVLNPGSGDTVQAFKAGIMEIADLFVINKADLPGLDKLLTEIEQMIEIVKHDASWQPPLIRTIATDRVGIPDLWQAILAHKRFLMESGEGEKRRSYHLHEEVIELVNQNLSRVMLQRMEQGAFADELVEVANRRVDPYHAAEKMVRIFLQR
ncbi:methylmalonyl Co-A mutase-associated GTPase MeaB [Brevibacillus halotolerans]|uniref:methylmalonyl Co-A mutase-associated GTPase MeaB n=1 Tax=Brevibacillus TaxID=55080 RepID=UPI0002403B82|nr:MULTISPECIES: methylmalonyl Co-A mutase-associated GTPase MeaB [Brevibacillus]MCR8963120.1 methylmalonyl Co-A mutase-associated GTPase MeaB [Brevibacillus laterosporus]MCR8996040.1 methylmalonyl Co-A mutase-associated GTPase MeaB [Brevibacillus laterosporus]MCZ0835276.1 methylmalonyl Co-A mutase-associated GTPase MeaB [Brevibacillus halotolerans]PCN45370.1 methylmalonyl Co-A mutase-associated GTPase MeaB [Brevibacillus laterosporus]WPS87662.1 methylmalonyl Co-A mutase-associated GTPase MeaB